MNNFHTLYEQNYKIRERQFERHKYPNYNIQKKDWKILEVNINPSKDTIEAIEEVLNKYGNPKNPSEYKWTYYQPNHKGYPIRNILNCITNIDVSILYIRYLSTQVIFFNKMCIKIYLNTQT